MDAIRKEQKVIDSAITREEAVQQNPARVAPDEVIEALVLESVEYYGFDGQLHEGQIVVHRAVASEVREFFALARELRFPIQKVIPICVPQYAWDDERSCGDNNSSGYNYRLIAGTTRMSKHAHGLAFDINPVQNVYIKYDADAKEVFRFPPASVYNIATPGTLTPEHALVRMMKQKGWIWGGDWKPERGCVDYQHFEKDL